MGDLAQAQLINTGGRMITGYAQGQAEEERLKREEEREKDYLRRYNQNAWQIS